MSVRVGDRSEGTLSVLNDIRILGEYTIQICKTEKVFPMRTSSGSAEQGVSSQSPPSVCPHLLRYRKGYC